MISLYLYNIVDINMLYINYTTGENMPTCKHCNSHFPNRKVIDGKDRNISRRKFCLECSPFGSHNTRPFIDLKLDIIPKCSKCGVNGKEHFYERASGSGSFYSYCKKCYNQQSTFRQIENKKFAVEYKGGKCQQCGYNKCLSSLEFHHLNPHEKDSSIRFTSCSREKLLEEISKCILVCANCHREIHAGIQPALNY